MPTTEMQALGVALAAAAQAWHRTLRAGHGADRAAQAYRATLASTLAKQARAAAQGGRVRAA